MTLITASQQTSDTPILDRQQPLPITSISSTRDSLRRRGGLIVTVILLLEIGWIGGTIWSPAVGRGSGRILQPAKGFLDNATKKIKLSRDKESFFVATSSLAVIFLGYVAAVVVHELGHLVAGWSAGLKLIAIRFGPIQVSPPLRIALQRNYFRGASGWTSMVPTSANRIRIRLLTLVLGGPAANLLSGLAILLLRQNISPFFGWFALVSVLGGLVNLVPFQRFGLVSDGKRVLMLLRGGGRGERWMAIIQLAAELRSGVLPENLSPEFLAMASAIRDDSADTVTGHVFAYSASWYGGTDAETAGHLETCLQYSAFAPPVLREALFADAGVFQGRKRKHSDLARAWLTELPEKPRLPWLRQRVEAAILEAEGDITGSLDKLNEVEQKLNNWPDRQQRIISLRSLERWRSELQAKLQTTSTSS